MIGQPDKILVVRFSSIGDIVLTTPLLRVLRRALPQARIDYVTKDVFAPLLEHNPRISGIRRLRAPYGLSELRQLTTELKELRYDLLLDLHNNLRSLFLRRSLGIQAATYRKGVLRRTLYVHLKWRSLAPAPPVRRRYFDAVRGLGLEDDGGPPEIWLTPEERALARSRAEQSGANLSRPVVGLALGAGKETKRWPAEHFAELAHSLRKELGAEILLLGGPEDRTAAELVRDRLDGPMPDFVGRTSLRETAALLALCDLVVTNDSGPMHLAHALNKRIVAVFGGTTPELGFAPEGPHVRIVERRDVRCRPCSHIGRDRCPRGHFKCMVEIRPEEVKQAVEELLSK